MGILGAAMAGGGTGLGLAAAKVGSDVLNNEFDKEKQEAIRLREENLARINNEAADRRLGVTEAGADRRLGVVESGQDRRQGAGFKHAEGMADAQRVWQGEQNEMQRGLTREQIQSHERISAANNATAREVANIGGTVQQDKEGNLLFFDKSGKPTQIMDPNNPDNPLRSHKDLTPAARAYSDVIKEQLKGLDREDLVALDDTQRQRINERRVSLNTDLLNVLTGGIGEAGKKPPAAPPSQRDIDLLKRNPAQKALFDQKFGAGAADKALGAKAAPATPGASATY